MKALVIKWVSINYLEWDLKKMAEIGEPDRVVRREREPQITPAIPAPTPELEPAK